MKRLTTEDTEKFLLGLCELRVKLSEFRGKIRNVQIKVKRLTTEGTKNHAGDTEKYLLELCELRVKLHELRG